MQDEVDGRKVVVQLVVVVVGLLTAIALGLGIIKVRNELAMTRTYDRQAAALERIAGSLKRLEVLDTARFVHDRGAR